MYPPRFFSRHRRIVGRTFYEEKDLMSSSEEDEIAPALRAGWLKGFALVGCLMLLSGLFLIQFDLLVVGDGVIEARTAPRLYAPRDARVESIHVLPGQSVEEGDLLMVLSDDALRQEKMDLEVRISVAEAEARLAAFQERELQLTGGGIEDSLAEGSLELHKKQMDMLQEIKEIYTTLTALGSAPRLEMLELESRIVEAERASLRDQLRVELRQQGFLDLQIERQSTLRALAETRIKLLNEHLREVKAQRTEMSIRSPRAGRVTHVAAGDPGMRVQTGDLLLSMVDVTDGLEARVFVPDRNVDLVKPGLPVRLNSHTFSANAEGYIHGTVIRMVTDDRVSPMEGFEVWISIDSTPVELVVGSSVTAEIILQRQGAAGLFLHRPQRERVP
jgi:multidrug resistance efflux pump